MAGRRARAGGLLVGSLGLLALLGAVAVFLQRSDLTTASAVGQLVSVVLAVGVAAVSLWKWWRQPPVVAEGGQKAVRRRLTEVMRMQWTAEAGVRGLNDRFTMPVQWRMVTDRRVVDDPARVVGGRALTGDCGDIARQFRDLPTRRLVVLGEAGAGKSTLALQLLLALLPASDGDEPVPVLLSLTSWNGRDLRKWIQGRLDALVPGAGMLPRADVLLVIDGLDEIPTQTQAAVVEVLNHAPDQPVIITCRTAEYVVAVRPDVLTSAAAIVPLPLTPAVAVDHLRSAVRPGEARDALVAALRSETPAPAPTEVAASPLGLWLLREAVARPSGDGAPVDWTAFPSVTALRSQLLDRLVPALLRNVDESERPLEHRASRRHSPWDMRRWLALVAEYMRDQDRGDATGRDLLWWRLPRTVRPWWLLPATYAFVGMVLGVCFGFLGVVGVAAGLPLVLSALGRPALTAAFGVAGAAAGWYGGMFANETWAPTDVAWDSWRTWARIGVSALAGAVGGGAAFVAIVLVGQLVSRSSIGAWFARLPYMAGPVEVDRPQLMLVFVLGAVFGVASVAAVLHEFVERALPPNAQRASPPSTTWRASRGLTLVRMAAFVLAGTTLGLALPITAESTRATTVLAYTLLGLAVGLFCAQEPWLPTVMISGYLVLRHRLPWRLMPLLEDAYRIGLLRAVGSAYQFRHAELQDHLLASVATPTDAAATHPPTSATP